MSKQNYRNSSINFNSAALRRKDLPTELMYTVQVVSFD